MITRIEIDGFKSFHDFTLDLQPFQVFIGPNGAGKSNLFDAITLLSNLAFNFNLYNAFNKNRGHLAGLFSILPDGSHVNEMSFAVEMLIARKIADSLGEEAEVSSTRLRYELKIEYRLESGLERLHVIHEALRAIPHANDVWLQTHIPRDKQHYWLIQASEVENFISTEEEDGHRSIFRYQDKPPRNTQSFVIGKIEQTIVSTVSANTDYPTIYAARQEMLSWWTLQLESGRYRNSDPIRVGWLKPDGSNLSDVMARIVLQDESILGDIVRDMINAVPTISDINVSRKPNSQGKFEIIAKTQNGTIFNSDLLSDGTLRVLTLVTLKNDPQYTGVVCLEEPENGVHPLQLEQIAKILERMATDFAEDEYQDYVLKQVLINTHSSAILPYIPKECIQFVFMARTEVGYVTMTLPIDQHSEDFQRRFFTQDQVRRFVDPQPLEKFLEELGFSR